MDDGFFRAFKLGFGTECANQRGRIETDYSAGLDAKGRPNRDIGRDVISQPTVMQRRTTVWEHMSWHIAVTEAVVSVLGEG